MEKIIQAEVDGVRLKLTLSTNDNQSHSRLGDFIKSNVEQYDNAIGAMQHILTILAKNVAANTQIKS